MRQKDWEKQVDNLFEVLDPVNGNSQDESDNSVEGFFDALDKGEAVTNDGDCSPKEYGYTIDGDLVPKGHGYTVDGDIVPITKKNKGRVLPISVI